MSEKVKIGKVCITIGGEYKSFISYDKLTCVYHDHCGWVSRKSVPEGVEPTSENSAYWQKVCDRGERGPQGQSYIDKELVPIVDDLTTGGSSNVLSAEQGKLLHEELVSLQEGLQTEVDSHDVAIEDLQENKVDKGDYAPALTAGFADNLVSKDVVVDSEFNLRRSGGGAISDGVARMEVVKGNSVVWNQVINADDYRANNSTITRDSDGWYNIMMSAQYGSIIFNISNLITNHQYLFSYEIVKDSFGMSVYFDDGFYPHVVETSNALNGVYTKIVTYTEEGSSRFRFQDNRASGWTSWKLRNVQIIDLTQMFGAGNEPTTIEEFNARKPIVEDEYAYNEGEVIHCNVDAVKSVGRNVWDEEWEVGRLNITTGQNQNSNLFIRSKNFVKVMPNAQYHITTPNGKWIAFLEYDESCQFLRYRGSLTGNVTTSADCAYMRFYVADSYGVTYNHDICINISDPDFNGQYEPYKEDVRELPSAIKEVFPNGMMSAGAAHDVAYNDSNKEVGVTEKRIGVVDLGTLNWYKSVNANANILWKAANLNDMGIAMNNNILCNQYVTRTSGEIYWDGLIGINVHDEANGMCFLYDPQYDDYDGTSFKAAMAGVMLYYELAEPIVTEHQEPFNLDYQVTNGGQEQAMATEPTSAFKAEIAYGFNASAKIKENANEIAQLKATIAQLQAALASMVNTNVEDYE